MSSISVIRLTSPTPSMQNEEKDQTAAETPLDQTENEAAKVELNGTKELLITKPDRSVSTEHSTYESTEEAASSTDEGGSLGTTDDSSHENIAEFKRKKLFSSSESEEESDYSLPDGGQNNDKARRNKIRHPRRNNRRIISAQSTAKKKQQPLNKISISDATHQPTVVGLRVEDFYSSNDANILIKHALSMHKTLKKY